VAVLLEAAATAAQVTHGSRALYRLVDLMIKCAQLTLDFGSEGRTPMIVREANVAHFSTMAIDDTISSTV
jgi:hypothetical protein